MRNLKAIIFIILLSVADIFLFRIGVLPLEPSYSIIPILFLLFLFDENSYERLVILKKSNTLNFFLILFLVSIFFSIFTSYQDFHISIGLSLLSILLYVISVLYFFTLTPTKILKIFSIAYIVLALSILVELVFGQINQTRGSGFAENPNGASLRLIFLVIVILQYSKAKIYKVSILFSLLLMNFLTLSRSGVLISAIVIIIYLIFDFEGFFLKNLSKSIFKSLAIFFILLISFFYFSDIVVRNIPSFEHRASIQRINQIKGNEGFVTESDYLKGGRLSILYDYYHLFVDNPFGYGTGTSSDRNFYPKATHNMFLRLAIDYGILGISAFLFFLIFSVTRSFQEKNLNLFIFYIVIFLASFFTNTLFENRTFLISMAAIDIFKRYTSFREWYHWLYKVKYNLHFKDAGNSNRTFRVK